MKHNILTLFLAILLIIVGTNVSVAAVEIDGINYELNKNYYTAKVVDKSTEYEGAIVIPSSLTYSDKTYSVTSIGPNAFSYCSGLTSVTIPNSVTSIEVYAFSGCSGLTSVTIGSGVTSIGDYAFQNCSKLTSVTIGNSVTSIGNHAFQNCSGLTSVIIPNSVTSIGDYAFYGCRGLTSVTIGNSVTSIREYAFYDCNSLRSVTIPNRVTFIGHYAFANCNSLRSVTIPNSVNLIENYAFANCSGELIVNCKIPSASQSTSGTFYGSKFKSVTIGEGVTSIGSYAFYNCDSLTTVTIPSSVTSIGSYAFEKCSGLTKVVLNSNAIAASKPYSSSSSIGKVFGSQVKEYILGDDVTSIGEYAFEYCSGLTSVTIGNSVTSIGEMAFYGCSGLTSISVESGNKQYDSRNNCNAIIETASNTLIVGCKKTLIPNSVTSIGKNAFYWCSGLTSVTIPNSVTSIGNNAFYWCSRLTSVTIPNSVTNIGNNAFYECSGLTSVTIGNSVTSIGNSAFEGCSELTSVTIGNSVTSIGNLAFYDCSGLTSVTIPNSVTSIGGGAFSECSGLTKVYCNAENVPTTSSSAFQIANISNATLIVPESSVAAYMAVNPWRNFGIVKAQGGSSVFYNGSCGTNVKYSLNTSTGVLNITGTGAMTNYSSYSSVPWYNNKSYIKVVEISNGVTSIGGSAFSNCYGLTSITIPNSVTSIGNSAFSGCSGLTAVHITDLAAWCKINFSNGSVNPLYNAHHLFMNGEEIKDLVIPSNVTSIGGYAFYSCSGLTSVIIPNSVTSIGSYAFYNCGGLKKMKVDKTTPINITSDVFNNTSSSVLYVPKGRKSSYSSANYWKNFKTIKEFPDGDVNWDNETDVIDVVDIARFVVGTPRNAFDDFLADMNSSGSINVADAVVLVNDIAGNTQFARSANRVPYYNNDVLSLCYNNEDRLSVQLEGTERYTAFQFDLWLPSDMNLMSLSLNNLRSQGHQLLYNKVEDGHYRVVVVSTSGETFNGKAGELLSMMLDGYANDDIRIDNIHFITSQGYDVPFNAVNARYSGAVTNIQGIEPANVEKQTKKQVIYNLKGQRLESLKKGINIVGGRKIIVK